MKFKYYIFILLLAILASCKPEIDEFTPSKGGADFTSYLAVGNSLTAGYADGSLYKSGQENSFPNILSKQFSYVGGGEFKQPLMVDDYGFGIDGITPVPKLILGETIDCMGVEGLGPVRADVTVNPGNFASVAQAGPFNNIGVPGAKAVHFDIPGYSTLNPYFARFAVDQTTPLIDYISGNATFFTLWIGNNDALGYALSGGAADMLTPPAAFSLKYENIVKACIASTPGAEAKGALANLPDILSIPYCSFMSTQIPYNSMVLTAEQAAGLTQLYTGYGYPNFVFQEGPNPLVVENPDGTWGRMTAEDQFLMSVPTDSMQCHGMGVAVPPPGVPKPFPIPHQYILDKDEIADIRNHTDQYNATIMNLATTYNLAYVDMKQVLIDAGATGIVIDGYTITSGFITGNAFSLDGIHLTPVGNAMAAHYYIEAINATYGASIPQVVVPDYEAVTFP